jgi:rRNA maturation endonuclease Nob1
MMSKDTKEKKRCPICDAELVEDEDICPECGSCIDEPAYDAIDDEGN